MENAKKNCYDWLINKTKGVKIQMETKTNILFTGVMSALVSCVDEDGNVYERSMRRLMNDQMKAGLNGFYLCGELARHAGRIGLDAISSVPPFFFHYGEAEIADYYKALSDASGLPVLMYASPLSGVSITWDMVDRFMDIPNMIGLKWTSYDYFTMHRIKELRSGNINVINGPDECLLCGLAMGADGGIGATYNVMPKLFSQIYCSFRAGDLDTARAAQYKANKLIEILLKFGVVCGIKDILTMLGYDCGYQVYPQKRFTDEERAAFRAELETIHYMQEYV